MTYEPPSRVWVRNTHNHLWYLRPWAKGEREAYRFYVLHLGTEPRPLSEDEKVQALIDKLSKEEKDKLFRDLGL